MSEGARVAAWRPRVAHGSQGAASSRPLIPSEAGERSQAMRAKTFSNDAPPEAFCF